MPLRKTIILLFFLLVLAFITLLPSSPYKRGVNRDSGVFLYIGSRILDGQIPYRDAWDHKGPIIYFVNAAGLALGNGSQWGVWFLEVLSFFATLALAYSTLRQAFYASLALFGALSLSIGMLFVLEGGNLTEEYALLFQFWALYLFTRDISRPASSYWVLLGVSLALAFWLRQNLIGTWVAIVLYWLASALSSHAWRLFGRRLFLLASGFSAITALVVAYFATQHALKPMWEAVFEYNVAYSSSLSVMSRARAPLMGINYLAASGISLIAFSGWIVAAFHMVQSPSKNFDNQQKSLIGIALVGLPVEIMFTSISGRYYRHYFITWLPMLILLGCYFIYIFFSSRYAIHQYINIIIPKILLISLIASMTLQTSNLWWDVAARFLHGSSRDPVSDFIERSIQLDSYVLMWGAEAKHNFLADRRSPTRYVYQYPLYMRNYHTPAMIDEFLNELKEHPPAIIIDTSPSNAVIPPLDRIERNKWQKPTDPAYEVLPETEAVFAYVESHYQFTGVVGTNNWRVYTYIGQALTERN